MLIEKNKKTPYLHFLALSLLLCGLITISCYQDFGMTTKDYDLVAAYYDNNADFTQIKTYFLPDTVHHIVKEGDEDKITRKFDEQILAQIDVNLQTLGYERVKEPTESQKPDVFMYVAATSQDNYYLWGGYPWYPWYPWYPGWGPYPPGWGYPWYPSYGVSSYSSGTLFFTMIDPEKVDPETEKLKGLWIGSVNGLLDDSESNIRNRLNTAINEAFRISPYLGVN